MICHAVFAAKSDLAATVEKVDLDNHILQARVRTGYIIQKGDELRAGQLCPLKVIKVKGSKILVTTDECKKPVVLKPGVHLVIRES